MEDILEIHVMHKLIHQLNDFPSAFNLSVALGKIALSKFKSDFLKKHEKGDILMIQIRHVLLENNMFPKGCETNMVISEWLYQSYKWCQISYLDSNTLHMQILDSIFDESTLFSKPNVNKPIKNQFINVTDIKYGYFLKNNPPLYIRQLRFFQNIVFLITFKYGTEARLCL